MSTRIFGLRTGFYFVAYSLKWSLGPTKPHLDFPIGFVYTSSVSVLTERMHNFRSANGVPK